MRTRFVALTDPDRNLRLDNQKLNSFDEIVCWIVIERVSGPAVRGDRPVIGAAEGNRLHTH
ncbi:hypothetical protein [Streptomyces sp. NPDC051993]|uniref:hypothetical protein n=1 Tax=unclassified Streptomyces TaxID=2593676 RepID=UPI003431AC11